MTINLAAEQAIASTSRLVRQAVGCPPVVRWQHKGEPPLLVESYLFPSRTQVVLPKFPAPIIGVQLDGRKLVCRQETASTSKTFAYAVPNRCVLIPPDTESYWTPGSGSVMLSGVYIGGAGEAAIRKMLNGNREPMMLRDSVLVALTRQMLALANDPRALPAGYVEHLIGCFVAHLEWLANAPLAARPVRNTTYDSVISDIFLLIEENLEQPLTIDMLASAANMSAALFRKRFTDIAGMSVHQYVMKARLERASELIDECNLPLSIVAAQCGFSSQSHMTRIFRRERGMTPAELRRRGGAAAD